MASWTYIPIFAKDLGASDTEIGLIVAFYSLALFLSSFIFGRASDNYGRKFFLLVGLALSMISFFMQIFAYDLISLLLMRILAGFCIGIFPPSLIAYIHENRKDLSKFTSFGSLGWALGAIIAGGIAIYFTIIGVFIFSSFLFFLAFLVSLKMKFAKHDSINVPTFPVKIIKKNLSLYLAVLIRHTGGHMIWTFWPLFLLSLGANLFWVGVIQMINSMTQFIFMYTLSGKIKYVTSITIGLLLASLTFFIFTLATDFWQLMPLQILLGVSWSLMYVGGLRYLMDRNVEKATVSGLFDSVLSLSSITGPFLATFVLTFGNYRTIMYLAAVLAFVSFLLFKFSNDQDKLSKLTSLN
jgi:DHA1 family quinolone resistance protein-like MFS transporter